jgi:hypothetical protein
MVKNEQRRLHVHWFDVAFALAWIGALSVYWIHIKTNVRFQAILSWGIGLTFPVSLIYVTVIYIAAIAGILWAGLAIYLAVTGGFSFRRLFRGLLVIVLVAVPFLVAGLFLNGLLLPPVLRYTTLWLPLFLALWLSIWVGGLRCRQRNVRFAPKAVE